MKITKELQNKKILFFSVKSFNIENQIKSKLIELGAIVDYFDERPKNSILTKAIIRINKNIIKKRLFNYYNGILKEVENNQYDFLFVVRGEVIPDYFIKKIKSKNPNCSTIFYTWDSFKNNSNPLDIIDLFDKKFTFDRIDSKKYNIEFRPLFYFDSFKHNEKNKTIYDLLFLGTAHSDRYKIVRKIEDILIINGLKTFSFFYLQSIIIYVFRRFFDKKFKKIPLSKISFKSLNELEINQLYKKSNVILDINHPNQTGLTMRTFESIGAKKKLITTNKDIVNYVFFNNQNIFIIDRENPSIDLNFFKSNYINISEDLYVSSSIDGWLYSLFVKNSINFIVN